MRFFVIEPTELAGAWWSVADRESDIAPNLVVGAFHESIIDAEDRAHALADDLNKGGKSNGS